MPKFRVYANYTGTKVIGVVEAENKEQAIDKAVESAPCDITLCSFCSRELVDGLTIDEETCTAELVEKEDF